MVAPLVVIGAGIVLGAGAVWRVLRSPLSLNKPIVTKKANPVRILASDRVSPDGCSIVAAVYCGSRLGEVISLYSNRGSYGGTLWSLSEQSMGTLEFQAERDLSSLVNTAEPVLPPLSATPRTVSASSRPPMDFSRPVRTRHGNRVRILAEDRLDPEGGRIVALVKLQWFRLEPLASGPMVELEAARTGEIRGDFVPVDEQVINVYDITGQLQGTVIADIDSSRGQEYLRSVEFDARRDTSDLCYAD